jgi:hypothetical protein
MGRAGGFAEPHNAHPASHLRISRDGDRALSLPELEVGASAEAPPSVPPPGDVVAVHPAATRLPETSAEIERNERAMCLAPRL